MNEALPALAVVAAPVIGAYQGYGNVKARGEGMQSKFADQNNVAELELENNVRAVFYGAGRFTTFFNMRADSGLFFKDLSFGEGGDMEDLSPESKEDIVKQTFELVKKGQLTADKFYSIIKAEFLKQFPGEAMPQKETTRTAYGTDTYFTMLDEIQKKYTSGQTPAQQSGATGGGDGGAAATGGGAAATGGGGGTAKPSKDPNLQKKVKKFQASINMPAAEQDGVWGKKTQAALRRFLISDAGLTNNDIIGATVDEVVNSWVTAAPKITKFMGKPATFPKGNIDSIQRFIDMMKTAGAATISESKSKVNIVWGR